MDIANFPESNAGIGAYGREFRIFRASDAEDRIVICWKLNWYERFLVLFTGRVWQQSLLEGKPLQGSAITAVKPVMEDARNSG